MSAPVMSDSEALADPSLLASLLSSDGARAFAGGVWPRLPDLLGQLPRIAAQLDASLLPGDGITPSTRLRRIPMSSLSFTRNATALHLKVSALDAEWIERTTLALPAGAACAPVLDWLATSRAAFRVDALAQRFPSLAFDDLRPLLHGLVQVSLLCVLPYPELQPAG